MGSNWGSICGCKIKVSTFVETSWCAICWCKAKVDNYRSTFVKDSSKYCSQGSRYCQGGAQIEEGDQKAGSCGQGGAQIAEGDLGASSCLWKGWVKDRRAPSWENDNNKAIQRESNTINSNWHKLKQINNLRKVRRIIEKIRQANATRTQKNIWAKCKR